MGCITERAVYSVYEYGSKKKEGSSTLDEYNRLQRQLENGYIYEEVLSILLYHTMEGHNYNYTIKPHYYKHKDTKGIFTVCYGSEGLMSKK